MRARIFRSVIVSAVLAVSTAGLVSTPAAADTATYYVSLGDSLAAGYQPDTKKDEPVSYTDRVYDALSAENPGLVHIRLGCDGETTVTMVDGGRCAYPDSTSQLDAAVTFMDAHPGKIKYVTNDIGANDIYHCVSNGSLDVGCIVSNLVTIQSNLSTIDSRLRAAGGDGAVYVGMTYYNPLLASWLKGGASEVIATATTAANNILSQVIASTNSGHGWMTADVAAAFSSDDFTLVDLPGVGSVPKNVARVCTWTWMCALGDIHANLAGHQVIADTFLPLLTTSAPGGAGGSLGAFGALAGAVAS